LTARVNLIKKWGSEGIDNGQFKTPHGVAIDPEDNVYITDMDNFRVQKFDSNGNFLTKWGSEGSEDGQFTKPEDIAVDSKTGNVYITDTGNSRIQVFGIANHYKPLS
jgi:DNA-binding beta-propeller fold protein YncE